VIDKAHSNSLNPSYWGHIFFWGVVACISIGVTLAEKIKLTKGFESQARVMVKDLKDTGFINPHEEKILLEMIQDKVLEEFHVERRDGRTRGQGGY
jgi:hypothetical protein